MPEPELPAWLHWIWRAFWRLHHDRPWRGGGLSAPQPGHIPWTAMAGWCEVHGYSAEQLELLDDCLTAMDEVYLEWEAEQRRRTPARPI